MAIPAFFGPALPLLCTAAAGGRPVVLPCPTVLGPAREAATLGGATFTVFRNGWVGNSSAGCGGATSVKTQGDGEAITLLTTTPEEDCRRSSPRTAAVVGPRYSNTTGATFDERPADRISPIQIGRSRC